MASHDVQVELFRAVDIEELEDRLELNGVGLSYLIMLIHVSLHFIEG